MNVRSLHWQWLAPVLVAGLAIGATPLRVGAQAVYKKGAKVADFALKDDNAKTVRLSDFRGRVVVLVFYASWCSPCNDEAPALERDLWQAYRHRGVSLLGCAIAEGVPDPATKLALFRRQHKVTYPLLSDESLAVFDRFGGGGIPALVLLDKQGRFVARYDTLDALKKRLPALLNPTRLAQKPTHKE